MSGSSAAAWSVGLALVSATGAALGATKADPAVDPTLDRYATAQHLVRLDDGRRMNLLCEGQGAPTVILESGAGGSTLEWRRVQPEIA